ncbi:MAG: hypothetical protein GWN71_24880, partial [Gammaproteobacteria bacterium]|nr:hypothetical protein [Gammaproteobacteria bacterium]
THDPAVGPVPAEEELFRLAETDPTAAAGAYAAAARIVPGHTLFREHVLARAARFADPGDTAVLNAIVRD